MDCFVLPHQKHDKDVVDSFAASNTWRKGGGKQMVEIGDRFGMLTVLKRAIPSKEAQGNARGKWYTCRCDCGGHKDFRGYSLKAGQVKSCGCLRRGRRRHKDSFISSTTKQHAMDTYGLCEKFFEVCT